MKFGKLKFLLLILALALPGITVYAQSYSNILVNVVPPNPAPNENVTINLSSYVNNLDSVLITWSLGGSTVFSGIGKKTFSTTVGGAGTKTNVVATIALPDGAIETKITIEPSVMVLLWQATDSYVPPFYRGKALPTPDSEVKVVAMPEVRSGSSNVPAQNMTYYWKKDYTNNVDGSGYGKNYFVYVNDYLEDSNTISVTASTIDQQSSTDASINIGMTQPKILFYKNDSTLGTIWQNSLTDPYRIEGSEVVEAAPYFISPKEIQSPALVWNWSINDSIVSLGNFKKNLMPLDVATGTYGTSKLELTIENRNKIFQTTNKEINIEF